MRITRVLAAIAATGALIFQASTAAATPTAATPWREPTRAAAAALMNYYNPATGAWTGVSTWHSANALTAIINYARTTGDHSYDSDIATVYDDNLHRPGADNFAGRYLDDTGWWALALVDAYDYTGDSRYLSTAAQDADYIGGHWDATCGGGVYWSTDETYKNAITNELYLRLTAALHNRIPADTRYLARARAEWTWLSGSGLINDQGLVQDGINPATCAGAQQGQWSYTRDVWTYNQGVLSGALAELSTATGDISVLPIAGGLAAAWTTNPTLNPAGILTEPCTGVRDCGTDAPSFKGAAVRGLALLDQRLPFHPFRGYLLRQADSAYRRDRDPNDRYGMRWAGPWDATDAARQQSALDLLNTVALVSGTGAGSAG